MYITPGASGESRVEGFPTGLAGTVRFRILDNVGGTSFGPTTAGITEDPSGSGSYVVTFTAPTTAGQYSLFWDTGVLGPGTTATEELVVTSSAPGASSPGGRDLVTLAEAKDWLNVKSSNTTDDGEIQRVITDISNRFHNVSQREFRVVGTNPQTRMFFVDDLGAGYRIASVGDLASFTAVSIIAADWTTVLASVSTSDIIASPEQREEWEPVRRLIFNKRVIPLRYGYRLSVTGNWGFPSIPGSLRQAVLEAIAEELDREVESYSQDYGTQSSGEGTNVIVLGSKPQLLPLPPRALSVAQSYRDPLVA